MKRFIAILVACGWCALAPAAAQAQAATESALKAANLYRFLPFIQWPAGAFGSPDAPYVIQFVGGDDVASDLREIAADRRVAGRALSVRSAEAVESLDGVHVLFVGRSAAARLPAIAKAGSGKPVLIVCDWPGALDQGAGINFLNADGRVRFEVSVEATERAQLKVSARMLAVAHRVKPRT